MDFDIVLQTGSGQPIYEQIEQQIQALIVSGQLHPGTAIPSIRQMAKLLRVSVITVQKAYDSLKASGLIESAVGRGTIVARTDPTRAREAAMASAEVRLQEAVRIARGAGLSLEELCEALKLLFEED